MSRSKQEITISQIIEDLDNGLKRGEIAEKYGLNMSEVSKIFQHPKLRGLKARKPVSFLLIDDLEVEETEEVEEVENQTNLLEQIKEVEEANVDNVSKIDNPTTWED